MTARRRTTRQIPAWMTDYYANSVGGGVINSYRTGRVVTVDADKAAERNKSAREAELLAEAEAELADATDEVNRQYWLFTRTARGAPPTADACRRREAARKRVMALRHAL